MTAVATPALAIRRRDQKIRIVTTLLDAVSHRQNRTREAVMSDFR